MLSVDQLEDKLIDLAFAEDIGDGDHTTLCCIPEDAMGKSHLLIKEDGVLAGVEMAKKVFARFDPTMKVEVLLQDGTHCEEGRHRYDRRGQDPFSASDRAPDAQHHAAYEWYRYHDS